MPDLLFENDPPCSDCDALALAIALRNALFQCNKRLALVESCTAGRVAATLGLLPGISQWLCGSLVVYRSGSKAAWLGVPASLLDDPQRGPVSGAASRYLADAALERTPEADVVVAITGDIGPGAPAATDGRIYLACATRQSPATPPTALGDSHSDVPISRVQNEQELKLLTRPPEGPFDIAARRARILEATCATLAFALAQFTCSAPREGE